MNTAKIKEYAQRARRDFLQAITEKSHMLGLSEERIEPAEIKGDYAIIAGRPFPKVIEQIRQKLVQRIQQDSFELMVRSVAYTWFNRFVALRYMELHDYLDHGYRVLSNRNGSEIPEILENATDLDLHGLDKDKVAEFRLAGNKDNELYRLLIIAQCNVLHRAMPFLFEKLDDETELLLPDNLLQSDSPIRKLIRDIDETDWESVEIIGWIYQYYISERKEEVIGKVIKSRDIPAATQLFTPNWIVKYMVQNSLGRLWLNTYPNSPLREKMDYFIKPADQSVDVRSQLKKITPGNLDPVNLTVLDPACGSGHILVEAYNLLKFIYQERGYRLKDIPRLIIEKNLFGVEIDDRAAQLSGFALMMKARADDRRILEGDPPFLNIATIKSSAYIDAEEISKGILKEKVIRFKNNDKLFPALEKQRVLIVKQRPEVNNEDIVGLLNLFKHGKLLGSLINIPEEITKKLYAIDNHISLKMKEGDLFERRIARQLLPFVKQAVILSGKYSCVIANPPYLGTKSMTNNLKALANTFYPISKTDFFAMFIQRCLSFTKSNCYTGLVTPYVWMFIKSFQNLRKFLARYATISSLIQLEYNAFEPACVPVCTFILKNANFPDFKGEFIKLSEFKGHQNQGPKTLEAINNPECGWRFTASSKQFSKVPGYPIAYWISDNVRDIFPKFTKIGSRAKKGITTADNAKFLRFWHEVAWQKTFMDGGSKWYPMTRGGNYRKWYGNMDLVIDWENDGHTLKNFPRAAVRNERFYQKAGIVWNALSNSYFCARYVPKGFIFSSVGPMVHGGDIELQLCMLNSKVNSLILTFLCPTMNFEVGSIALIPLITEFSDNYKNIASVAIDISREDWNSFESSWDFKRSPLVEYKHKDENLDKSYQNWEIECHLRLKKMKQTEEDNNKLLIGAYGLQGDLTPEVNEDQITVARANPETDIKGLISYAIGCMMGRYSLDEYGLIFAHSGNECLDLSRYMKYPADDDGIIPIMEIDWFSDDAANRFTDFLKVAWSSESLEENLKFVTDNLKPKSGEKPRDTIRRYLSTNFFKDHLRVYRKRPIYWLFSSGKYKAFECLVYLHRYNESTLSRMRSSYVTPLQGKFNARVEYLQNELEVTITASAQKKLQKELDSLRKKQVELAAFDDELRHYADMRIELDLDDGVKVNYAKFGNLLAEKKIVTGQK